MPAKAIVNYRFSRHAREEMARRGIDEAWVNGVLAHPEQRWAVRRGRDVLQSRAAMGIDRSRIWRGFLLMWTASLARL